jgi:hemerythrin
MPESHAWDAKLDVGNEAMDHEHHLQVGLVSAFVDAIEQGRPGMARRLVDQLFQYSAVHFGSEELLMEGTAYPEHGAHAHEHAIFLEQIREVQRAYDAGDPDLATALAVELRAALAGHINDADRRLAYHVAPVARPSA